MSFAMLRTQIKAFNLPHAAQPDGPGGLQELCELSGCDYSSDDYYSDPPPEAWSCLLSPHGEAGFCGAWSATDWQAFPSLRALEVSHTGGEHAVAEALHALLAQVAPTLRTLCVLSAGPECLLSPELIRMLRSCGAGLRHLSMVSVETAILCWDTGEAAAHAIDPGAPSIVLIPWPHASGQEEISIDPEDEMAREMATDMLENASQGLCISLEEPARVLAHVPADAAGAPRACVAALPRPHESRHRGRSARP